MIITEINFDEISFKKNININKNTYTLKNNKELN